MKQTKKAKAFQLFTQGFTPSSPEIKALELYPSNRYKYFYEWQKLGQPELPIGASKRESAPVSSSMPSGETIGGVDETKTKTEKDQKAKPQTEETISQEEQMPKGVEEEDKDLEEGLLLEELPAKQPKEKVEDIGVVSEATKGEAKGKGEGDGQEKRIPTRVADDGIKCTVFLSLQTLALYKIAASAQAQHDGEEELNLGDFLDTCAEDFFSVRGKKLGLISTGGK